MTAAGEDLPIVDQVSITVNLGDLERRHNFLVVTSLITPAIVPAVPSLDQDSQKFSVLWESGVALREKVVSSCRN